MIGSAYIFRKGSVFNFTGSEFILMLASNRKSMHNGYGNAVKDNREIPMQHP